MSSNENSNDKKYIGLESLRTFLNNLKYLFVDKTDYDSHDHNNFEEAKRYADSLSDNYEAAGSIITAIGEIPKGDGDEPIASNVVGYVDIKVDELSNGFSTVITQMYGGEIPEDNFTIQEIAEEKAIEAVNSAFEVANGIYVVKEEGKGLSTNDLTDVLKSYYDDAYNHSVEPHAPTNAQENIIESIKVNNSPLAVTANDKSVNISIPTDYVTSSDISNLAEKATTLSGYGITDAYTKSEVDQLDVKITTLIGTEKVKDENGNDTNDLLDANKSVRTIANEELTKQLVPESAIESLDTLTEIAAWIQSHPDSASAMNEEISKLISKTALGTYSENGSSKEYNTVKAYVEAMIDLEETRADAAYDKNIIESIKVNNSALVPSNDKSVDITIPTDNASLTNGAGYLTSSDISGKANKSTTLGGYGITNAYTKTEVNGLLDNKVSKEDGRDLSANDLTDTLKSNYDDAYKHSQDEHATVNAQENVIESIKVNGTDLTVSSKSVNITIPTDNASFTNGAGYLVASDIAAKANKSTTLGGYGITNAYTKTEIEEKIDIINNSIDNKMDSLNPTGTGYFSLNRKQDTDIGDCSFAEGVDTIASGNYSHAEGCSTVASGFSSHAEGCSTVANDYSHAEGFNTTASGSISHAEGDGTTASGSRSHAEGSDTTASGSCSHVEGRNTIASGYASHAEGIGTIAYENYSHAQGRYNNIEDTKYAHIVGNGSDENNRSNAHTLDWNGNAWFAGDVRVGGTSYNDASEVALKSEVADKSEVYTKTEVYTKDETYTKDEVYTKSEVDSLIPDISGKADKSEVYTKDEVDTKIDIIDNSIDNKMDSLNPTGTGYFSLNRKEDTIVGSCSHAEGSNTTASGGCSHAEGNDTIASGYASHAEGQNTTASGARSHAEGGWTTASEMYSHAEGRDTTASGTGSHAEGTSTTASGDSSHAEGGWTTASGNYSHAEGSSTVASGNGSHAEGEYTTAASRYQHVQGKYNVEDTNNKYAHIVGNGSPFEYSNAHTLDWDGNAWFAGNVRVGGTYDDNTSGSYLALQSEVATKSEVEDIRALLEDGSVDISDIQQTLKEVQDVINANGDVLNVIGGKADKATTLAGYGIDDAYTKSEVDNLIPTDYLVESDIGSKADKSDTYTKSEVDAAISTEILNHTANKFHLTSNERTKLAGIEAGAEVNTVVGVKGNSESVYRTGEINITKDNIGLSNVDNTSDANKPVSNAQSIAISESIESAKAYTNGEITKVNLKIVTAEDRVKSYVDEKIDIINVSIGDKADFTHTHSITDITNLQFKLDEKQSVITGGATTIVSSNLGANKALISDSNGKVAVSSVTSTELGYLSGIERNVQSQLDTKISTNNSGVQSIAGGLVLGGTSATSTAKGRLMITGHTNPLIGLQAVDSNGEQLTPYYFQVANDIMYVGPTSTKALSFDRDGNVELPATLTVTGTISGTLSGNASSATKATQDSSGNIITSTYATKEELDIGLNAKQPTITGGATTITSSNLTASRALVSNLNGKVAVSDITSTELNYLDGVTSNIQTQLNGKAATHSHPYAGSSTQGGSATSAVKLDTATAGSATQPVYFSGGKPVATTYELNASVPSNAVFTDTKVTNTLATTTKAYVTGTTSATTKTGTQVFDTGVYLDTTAGQLVASTFVGALNGNATTATKATQDGNGNVITNTYQTKVTGMPTQFITCTTTDESQFPDVVEGAILIAYDA